MQVDEQLMRAIANDNVQQVRQVLEQRASLTDEEYRTYVSYVSYHSPLISGEAVENSGWISAISTPLAAMYGGITLGVMDDYSRMEKW